MEDDRNMKGILKVYENNDNCEAKATHYDAVSHIEKSAKRILQQDEYLLVGRRLGFGEYKDISLKKLSEIWKMSKSSIEDMQRSVCYKLYSYRDKYFERIKNRSLEDTVNEDSEEYDLTIDLGEAGIKYLDNGLSQLGQKYAVPDLREEVYNIIKGAYITKDVLAGKHSVMLIPIEELKLSTRVNNVLLNYSGALKVGDLTQISETELFKTRNCGENALNELKSKMSKLGVSLKP